ncbi:MAG: ribonuclease E inhibitor RraB [Dehalococcoidales bacterium]|nr:ribonuclease E inhibitor RraB [Dehalococcoidales bacterium]
MEWDLNKVIMIFNKMKEDGWDTSTPLKWGFFFMNSELEPLKRALNELKDYNYKLESIHETDDHTWVMQVSKTEILTPEKLHARNISFKELAYQLKIDVYDGWDVGKPDE